MNERDKKSLIIMVVISIIEFVFILLLAFGYFEMKNKTLFGTYPQYSITDEEYLGIDEISELNINDSNYKLLSNQLKDDVTDMLLQLFDHNNVEINCSIKIENDTYDKIIEKNYGTANIENIQYEKFSINSILVRHNFQKAVVGITYVHEFSYNNIDTVVGVYQYPTKLYLTLVNDQWVLVDWEDPI